MCIDIQLSRPTHTHTHTHHARAQLSKKRGHLACLITVIMCVMHCNGGHYVSVVVSYRCRHDCCTADIHTHPPQRSSRSRRSAALWSRWTQNRAANLSLLNIQGSILVGQFDLTVPGTRHHASCICMVYYTSEICWAVDCCSKRLSKHGAPVMNGYTIYHSISMRHTLIHY